MKVLMIDDDPQIVEAITLCLKLRWPDITTAAAGNGADGLRLLRAQIFDIVTLDLNLPDTDGFDVLQKIRRFSQVPVVIMSVRGREDEEVRGLEIGADDYIIKPFRPRDLLARVTAVLRRCNQAQGGQESFSISRGSLTLRLASNEVRVGNTLHRLTPTECLLLYVLMKNAGSTVGRETIMKEVWGKDEVETEVMRTYIRRLRTRINDNPPQIILTEHGEGYRFAVPD